MVTAYLNGSSQQELVVRFRIDPTTVRAHLRRREVLATRPYNKLHGELLERAKELYAAGRSLRSVASELGVSRETVRSGLLAGGVVLRGRGS
ncbi:MAG TPA: hypothetical protein VNS19_23135 [Acidimicrobiales bacterium]|nr:hypothetical protein [Acidimicrobiales bacterium]